MIDGGKRRIRSAQSAEKQRAKIYKQDPLLSIFTENRQERVRRMLRETKTNKQQSVLFISPCTNRNPWMLLKPNVS